MCNPSHLRGALLVAALLCAPAASQDAPPGEPPAAAELAPADPAVAPDVPRGLTAPLETPAGYDPAADPGMGDFLWSFVRSMLMLGVVLALIYLVLHKGLGRLVQKTQSGRRMKVVERIALDQRRALYLVEVDGAEMLLAGTDGGVARVDRDEPPAPQPTPRSFTTEGIAPEHPPLTGVLAHEPPAEGPKNGSNNGRRAATEAESC